MKKKLKAIWHILTSDKFLCFTYEECASYNSEYMTADKIHVDEHKLSKYFCNYIDENYNFIKKNVKETF